MGFIFHFLNKDRRGLSGGLLARTTFKVFGRLLVGFGIDFAARPAQFQFKHLLDLSFFIEFDDGDLMGTLQDVRIGPDTHDPALGEQRGMQQVKLPCIGNHPGGYFHPHQPGVEGIADIQVEEMQGQVAGVLAAGTGLQAENGRTVTGGQEAIQPAVRDTSQGMPGADFIEFLRCG